MIGFAFAAIVFGGLTYYLAKNAGARDAFYTKINEFVGTSSKEADMTAPFKGENRVQESEDARPAAANETVPAAPVAEVETTGNESGDPDSDEDADRPVASVEGVTPAAAKALAAAGIVNLSDVRKTGPDSLGAIKGVGPKTVEALRKAAG